MPVAILVHLVSVCHLIVNPYSPNINVCLFAKIVGLLGFVFECEFLAVSNWCVFAPDFFKQGPRLEHAAIHHHSILFRWRAWHYRYLIQLDTTWYNLIQLDTTWYNLIQLAITCDHLRSLAITCDHLRSLAITCDHLGMTPQAVQLRQGLEAPLAQAFRPAHIKVRDANGKLLMDYEKGAFVPRPQLIFAFSSFSGLGISCCILFECLCYLVF